MSQLFRLPGAGTTVALLILVTGVAEAARVRGSIRDQETEVAGRLYGFTRTRVARPARAVTSKIRTTAVFLAVKDGESLPIPAPVEHQVITLDGLRFSPNIASCASDAQVSFVNADREPVTLTIDGAPLGTLGPGAQKTYVCSPGKPTRVVRVREWPHMMAVVYVGEVGVAGLVNDRGRFVLEAPRGSYELRAITLDGVILSRDVTVERRDIDLGTLKIDEPAGGAPPPPSE